MENCRELEHLDPLTKGRGVCGKKCYARGNRVKSIKFNINNFVLNEFKTDIKTIILMGDIKFIFRRIEKYKLKCLTAITKQNDVME